MTCLKPYSGCISFRLMRTILILTLLIAMTGVSGPGTWAAVSRAIIPFQGAVAVKPGQPPLDGDPYGAKFEIYTAAEGGDLVFEDIQQITIRNGAFSVELGGGSTPLSADLARDHEDLWLQITLDLGRNGTYDGDELIQPRIHLGAAPVALYSTLAGRADTLRLPSELKDAEDQTVAEINAMGAYIPKVDNGNDRDPERGAVYRDNTCIAWGVIESDGELIDGFGIEETDFDNDDFFYEIKLYNDVVERNNGEAYSVNITSFDNQRRPELAIYEPVSTDRLRVYIFGLDLATAQLNGDINIPRVPSAFSIQIFGRLDD